MFPDKNANGRIYNYATVAYLYVFSNVTINFGRIGTVLSRVSNYDGSPMVSKEELRN